MTVIDEGDRQRIYSTRFVGNTIVSDSRLKTQIKSKPGILWVFKGQVDRQEVDEDVDRLTAYYRSLGYFRARVGRELEYSESGKWLTLTFVIDEILTPAACSTAWRSASSIAAVRASGNSAGA